LPSNGKFIFFKIFRPTTTDELFLCGRRIKLYLHDTILRYTKIFHTAWHSSLVLRRNLGKSKMDEVNTSAVPRHLDLKTQFLDDPESPGRVDDLISWHYYDFMDAENDKEADTALTEMAVTGHIYLLWLLTKEGWISSLPETRKFL
jgi:hypothetical protein